MKKLVYLAIVAFAASMVACGNKEKAQEAAAEAAEEAPAAVEEVVEVVADSLAGDTAVVVEEGAAAAEAVAE